MNKEKCDENGAEDFYSKSAKIRVFKIVVLGDGGVGKSALTMQFVYHQFLETYDPNIEDSYQQQCRVDDEPAHLDILDTAGQPEFAAMREQYMRTGEGFIICYSVTDRRSFDEASAYKRLIDRVRNQEDVPIVLVGNKCDLESDRKVSTQEGQALASQWECSFYETSAALRRFVDDAFHGIIRRMREREHGTSSDRQAESRSASRWGVKIKQKNKNRDTVDGRGFGSLLSRICHR